MGQQLVNLIRRTRVTPRVWPSQRSVPADTSGSSSSWPKAMAQAGTILDEVPELAEAATARSTSIDASAARSHSRPGSSSTVTRPTVEFSTVEPTGTAIAPSPV